MPDGSEVRLDHDLPALIDQLVVPVGTAGVAPRFASVADAEGDAALLLLATATDRAVHALAAQIEILRNEMRLTMLGALAADRASFVESSALDPAQG